jgi:excisionase family DNA binding protein
VSDILQEPAGPNRATRRRMGGLARNGVVATEPEPGRMAITVPEAAYLLHCSPNTVWNLIAKGELQSFALGRKRLLAREDVESFIANARHVTGSLGNAKQRSTHG